MIDQTSSNFDKLTEMVGKNQQINTIFKTPLDCSSLRRSQGSRWAIAFAALTTTEHLREHNLEHTGVAFISYIHRCCTLEWVIKQKWEPKRKILISPHGSKTAYKPHGELWRWVLDLTEQIPFLQGAVDAPEVFTSVFKEGALGGVSSLEGKATDIQRIKRENGVLRKYKNPFDINQYPFSHELIKGALALAEKSVGVEDGFKRRTWDKFLMARSQIVKELQKNETLAIRKKGNRYYLNNPQAKKSLREIQEVKIDGLKSFA